MCLSRSIDTGRGRGSRNKCISPTLPFSDNPSITEHRIEIRSGASLNLNRGQTDRNTHGSTLGGSSTCGTATSLPPPEGSDASVAAVSVCGWRAAPPPFCGTARSMPESRVIGIDTLTSFPMPGNGTSTDMTYYTVSADQPPLLRVIHLEHARALTAQSTKSHSNVGGNRLNLTIGWNVQCCTHLPISSLSLAVVSASQCLW